MGHWTPTGVEPKDYDDDDDDDDIYVLARCLLHIYILYVCVLII